MTGRAAVCASVRARLEAYYTRYYRDALGIPGWRDLVEVRLDDEAYEARRVARLVHVLGRPLAGVRMLDVGCGTGGFDLAATRAGADVWGVDADVDAVTIARARRAVDRVARAEAEALPFADGGFDLVYCYSTLEHVRDARGALREMIRVLAPGGRLYVHTPNRWGWFEGHYKVFWPPGLAGPLARAYLRARSRPSGFLATVRPLSFTRCVAHVRACGGRVVETVAPEPWRPAGGPLWPLIAFLYRAAGVEPQIELLVARADA